MTPRLVSSILAAALLIVACSSSDDATTTSTSVSSAPDTQPSTTTTADVPAATTTSIPTAITATSNTSAPPSTDVPSTTSDVPPVTDPSDDDFTDAEASDRSAARTALITLSAFPDGWVEDPIEDDGIGTDEFEAEFDACLGRDDEVRVRDDLDRLTVHTGDFHPVGDDATTVSHSLVLAPDVATARTAMAEVTIDGAEPCLADVIGDFYRAAAAANPTLAGVEPGEVIVTRTVDGRDLDVAVGVLLEVPLTIGDQSVSHFLELLYQRKGRGLSELSFASVGSRFSRDGYTVLSDEVIILLGTIGV